MKESNSANPANGSGESEDGDEGHIVLFMAHDENRRRLADWFRERTGYTVSRWAETDPDPTDTGELCIVDLPALVEHREWLSEIKSIASPAFFPVVLARESDERALDDSLWAVIDETVTMPVRIPELERRLENLLERRRLSCDVTERLEETEERYEAVFEAVNDAILIVDPDEDRIVECNPRAATMLGYDRSELSSLSPCADIHADEEARYEAFVDRVLAAGRARTGELTCLRKDGTPIEVEVSASTLDEGDEPRVVFSVRNVTERREQARTVEHQRDRLEELNRITSTLYESIQAVVRASNRAELERAVCQGLSNSEVYRFAWIGEREADGDTVVANAMGGDAEEYLEHVRITADESETGQGPLGQALRTGEVRTVQSVAEAPEMEPWRESLDAFGVEATAAVPIEHDGDTYGALNLYTARQDAFTGEERNVLAHLGRTIGRAITGIRASEEAQLFREAVDHAGNAVYLMSTDGTISYVNPAFEEITGYSSAEAVGNTLELLKSDEHEPDLYHELWRTIRSGDVWESEIINRRKDGRRRYIEQTVAPIVDAEGNTDTFVAVNTDITEQRRRQQQLQVLYRVLRHNLRNQLNVIGGYVDILGESDATPQRPVAEISGAVDNLLQISMQARRIEGVFFDDDVGGMRALDDVVRNALEDMTRDDVSADVSVSVPETEYRTNAELGTAVRELLRNAIQHNHTDEPAVSLSVDVRDDDRASQATVVVADDGPGIPENERQVLRSGEETTLLHGTGLGLWLVNWIVSELGGSIDIADNDPHGTVVTLSVPVTLE